MATSVTTSNMSYLGDGNPDGVSFGWDTADKISFYGVTPVVQQTSPTAVTTLSAVSSSSWGFSTSTQANQIVTAINTIKTVLETFGLMA